MLLYYLLFIIACILITRSFKKLDIDLDFQNNFDPLKIFPQAVRASMVTDGELRKHPAGAYLQGIPTDAITGLSAIPYKDADALGYIKIDFLHLNTLNIFESKAEIRTLLKKQPDWSLLERPEIIKKLPHIHRHFNIVNRVKPKSVEELADCLALIRPAQRVFLDAYIEDRETVRKNLLYNKPVDSTRYYFKRPHALSYSLTIVLQLHLIKANII